MDSADTLRDNLLKNLATALTPFHGGPVTIEVLHRKKSGYWAARIHYPDRTMQLTGSSECVVLGYLCGSIMRDHTRPEILSITKELHALFSFVRLPMQLFILSEDPVEAATMACDRHVIKICTEVGQILTAALSKVGVSTRWKVAYKNNPLSLWVTNRSQAAIR